MQAACVDEGSCFDFGGGGVVEGYGADDCTRVLSDVVS